MCLAMGPSRPDCGAMAGDSKAPIGHPALVSERIIVITGGDAGYFDLMKDCIGSLRATSEGPALARGSLDFGPSRGQPACGPRHGGAPAGPGRDFDFPARDPLRRT